MRCFWDAESVVWILITYSKSLNQPTLWRQGLVGGMQSQAPAKQTNHTELVSFSYSSSPCVIVLPFLWSYQPIFELLADAFWKLFFIHLDICVIKSLSSLELVEGCLLNDLHAPRGIDLNLFGHGLRACKPIIPI